MADTFHILGLGGVGILVAHALAGVPNLPRLILLLHRSTDNYSRRLAVTRNGATEYQYNFSVEKYRNGCWYEETSDSPGSLTKCKHSRSVPPDRNPIQILIVAVKAHHTIGSIRLVKHRLNKHSAILFLQNGLGALDELDAELFPDPLERPYYMSGIVTHCVRREEFLSAVHTTRGSIALGASPRISTALEASKSLQPNANASILADNLRRTQILNTFLLSPQELLEQQLIKLATNSVYNPLTSLLECSVTAILTTNNFPVQAVSDALIREFSEIFLALSVLGLVGKEAVQREFSPGNLKRTIYQMGLRAGAHTTSMLQDLRNGAKTEIMYLNGYFMKWALHLGIECPANEMVIRMVLEKERQGP